MNLYCQIKHLEKALQYVRFILAGMLKKRNPKKWDISWIGKLIIKTIRNEVKIASSKEKFLKGITVRWENISTSKRSAVKTKIKSKNKNNFEGLLRTIKNLIEVESAHIDFAPLIIGYVCICMFFCLYFKVYKALLCIPLFTIPLLLYAKLYIAEEKKIVRKQEEYQQKQQEKAARKVSNN